MFTGCSSLQSNWQERFTASNQREWAPEMATLPFATIDDSQVSIHNIRNLNYVSDEEFVTRHYDRTIDIADIQSVDFIVVPFKQTGALAHTMISFGMRDGTYVAVSVEVRKEVGERYSPFSGLARKYELAYVVADEKDLIRVRTAHRDADVYVYPSIADAQQAQQLFVDVMQRVNELANDPEFYHTISNNCTTNLIEHVNNLSPDRIPYGWRVLLPGFSAQYAYDLGLLDNRIPFEDLQAIAYVNDLADQHFDDPAFSRLIRAKRRHVDRIVSGQNNVPDSTTLRR